MLKGKKLAVIGVGKLGEALVAGLCKNSALDKSDIAGTVGHEASVERVSKKLGISVSLDNKAAVKGKDIVLLAVKPQNMDRILTELKDVLTEDQLVISVAASVTTSFCEERLQPKAAVVRAMPNTPSVINVGMTGLCHGKNVSADQRNMAEAVFKCVGETVFVDESLMDAVTALSASGPAYLYVVIESLAEAGVKTRHTPRHFYFACRSNNAWCGKDGARDKSASGPLLKDTVTTPAGCTIDGLMELEEGKLRVTLIKAVVKAAERARELVNTQNKIGDK